ncbi:MAG: M28 family peptidase [Bacteroidales bacterium]
MKQIIFNSQFMKRSLLNLCLILLLSNICNSQISKIKIEDLSSNHIRETIDTLTSSYFEGRDINSTYKLNDFFSQKFQDIKLEPLGDSVYLQEINTFKYLEYSDSSYIIVNNEKLDLGKDFVHSLFDFKDDFNITFKEEVSETFFGGLPDKNIDSVLSKVDLTNKTVIFFEKINVNVHKICRKQGALCVIKIVDSKERLEKIKSMEHQMYSTIDMFNFHISKPNTEPFITIYLSPEAGAKILGIKKRKLEDYAKKYTNIDDSVFYKIPDKITLNIHREKEYLRAGNFVGALTGTDSSKNHVILSAHYDHLGKNENGYFPGANDNASGVAVMFETARILSSAYHNGVKPKNSIIFIAFGMEESRMLGSKFYVDNPILPLEKLKANINLDMIGRQDKYHDTIPNYIYALGPDSLSLDIKELMDSINHIYNFTRLEFLSDYPNANKFFSNSSDQVNFLKKGIPAVLINNGMHKDLHRTTDTKEKLNYETIENITKLLVLSVWELANLP